MKNKLFYILITMCQLIFITGTYVLSYYTKRKLGMNRWLMYHNMQWEKQLPVFGIKCLFATLIAVITSIIIYKYIKSKNPHTKFLTLSMIAFVIIAIYIIFYFYYFNANLQKTYYLNAIIYVAIYLFQLFKLLLISL